ncbi:uncharacterized protein K452DRAFT_282840 [Aplosporella prunicola CBS 121167]|uniref:DUF7707 domain-containing protein n=1 Tax=Aplosporella prunicola CBS 121167 TaxID=1176127 RepID=A0A6A6BTX2_9PEZI|nr:uncharacterized protein K452DRAFT_282840 [Aplosporella prunicola CBS 121167]KAF2146664.1 hypothetical protein K452DRAFT_282840 [Aplosporella prunicola CBS 121167]
MHYFSIFLQLATVASAINTNIDPDSVSISDRNQWCTSQKSACPLICLQTANNTDSTEENDCDPDTLQFSCVCSNGLSPNVSEYSETIPYFECTEYNNQCVSNCGSNNQCSYNCRANNPCGAQNPKRVNATTSASATAAATSSAETQGYGGFGDDDSKKNGASSLVVSLGANYGLAAVVGGLFAGAAVLL